MRTIIICYSGGVSSVPVARVIDLDVDIDGHPVLRGVSLTAWAGSITAIVGPNGAGKTTLIETMAGLRPPGAGRVQLAFPGEVALVAQHSVISDRLPITVGDLVAMGRWRRTGPVRPLNRADRAIVTDSLATVGLAALRRRPLAALSGGQRQRALLAQGLAQQARLLLLDEPMNALDAASRAAVNTAILAAAASGSAIVVVTHDLEDLIRVDAVVSLP